MSVSFIRGPAALTVFATVHPADGLDAERSHRNHQRNEVLRLHAFRLSGRVTCSGEGTP